MEHSWVQRWQERVEEGGRMWPVQVGQYSSWEGQVSPVGGCISDMCLLCVSVDLDCSVFFAKTLWEAMPNGVEEFFNSYGYSY